MSKNQNIIELEKNRRRKIAEGLCAQQAAQLAPAEGLVLNCQEDETYYSLLAQNHQLRGAIAPLDTKPDNHKRPVIPAFITNHRQRSQWRNTISEL